MAVGKWKTIADVQRVHSTYVGGKYYVHDTSSPKARADERGKTVEPWDQTTHRPSCAPIDNRDYHDPACFPHPSIIYNVIVI